jgi:hypothetical protein
MWRYDRKTDYIKAGRMRLADARELLEAPTSSESAEEPRLPHRGSRHLRGALYLAGYAIECALKAYIVAATGDSGSFTEAMDGRTSAGDSRLSQWRRQAHNLWFLWHVSELERRLEDESIRRALPASLKGRVEWRYAPTPFLSRAQAGEIIGAIRRVYSWINEQRRRLE